MIYKMYCIFSEEALAAMRWKNEGVVLGKLGAQAGHAFLHACWDAEKRFSDAVKGYRDSKHAFKIVLKVKQTSDLLKLEEAYREVCGVSLVTDAGFTVFDAPTTTCLGIGPIRGDLIGQDLKELRLLR